MFQERTWRKSSYSGGSGSGNCVEVSLAQDALVRDTKNASGAVLAFSTPAWRALINSL
ncbi:protein of unknown function [Lentzea waywayandensis]|jgi:hypothetical protein|uniref:DUF397 domain-containing protein n=1 Tax=Lentzea waywayandensis TaxID=84724 RepID=A0A1I6EY60_9PSEU|nr:DUF397 domain-containing protein [Lentzea waywayandensis]SFR22522.1 protein of unknown function [Lentzea waywayandensis]